MNVIVTMNVKGCVLCICKPTNRKLGLYTPLHVPSHPWKSISLDFVGGFPMSKMGHEYLHVVVDRFSTTCVLILCKKQITAEKIAHLFFQHVWVHLGLPTSLYQIETLNSLESFRQSCRE